MVNEQNKKQHKKSERNRQVRDCKINFLLVAANSCAVTKNFKSLKNYFIGAVFTATI